MNATGGPKKCGPLPHMLITFDRPKPDQASLRRTCPSWTDGNAHQGPLPPQRSAPNQRLEPSHSSADDDQLTLAASTQVAEVARDSP